MLNVVLRCVDSLRILFTPFLPFSSQELHRLLGYDDVIAGPLEQREAEEADGSTHTVLTGDYSDWTGRWAPGALPDGFTSASTTGAGGATLPPLSGDC